MAHQLVHRVAQVRGSVPEPSLNTAAGGSPVERGRTSRPSHGGQVGRADEDLKEALERLAGDEGLEAGVVEAQGAEDARQRGQHLARGWHVLDEEGVEHDVREAVFLERGQEGRLLEHVHRHHVRRFRR